MATGEKQQLFDVLRRAGVSIVDRSSARDVAVSSLADDSRDVKKGACFVAVRGMGVDGHDFIEEAIARGATSVVGERSLAAFSGVSTVRVGDSREALAKLAAAFYGLRGDRSRRLPLIGVTGTNGKTTVVWMLRAIMRGAGIPAALFGTIEYDLISEKIKGGLTTPGSLEMAKLLSRARDAGAKVGLLEVSSHALEQRRCDGLSFSSGVFTNLSGDHLDYHESMDAYFAAKRRLFDLLDEDGMAIVNIDDPRGEKLAALCTSRVVRYGLGENADISGNVESMNRTRTVLRIRGEGFDQRARLSLAGKHNASNVLAAFAAARSYGLSEIEIVRGLERVDGVPGRLQRVDRPGCGFTVFVDYAHTDDALCNVLRAVRPLTSGRLICIFGCGGDRDRTKRSRMGLIVAREADVAIVTSDNPRTEEPMRIIEDILPGFRGGHTCEVEIEPDRRTAISVAIELAEPGDTVVIAGKGHEDYQLVGDRVLPFDDASVAREMLARAGLTEGIA